MRNHIRLIYIAAILTGLVITAFQLFWARNTYKITERNFNTTASNLLQKAIDDNIEAQRKAGVVPFARSIQQLLEVDVNMLEKTIRAIKKKAKDSTQEFTPEENRQISRSIFPEADIKELTAGYHKVLAAQKIPLQFVLTFDSSGRIVVPVQVAGIFHSGCDEKLITARFSGTTLYLARQNAWSLSVSAILILITWCSLWYMLYIIRRQLRLDRMKNDFINNMTHELRTPLAILRSTHEALDQFGYIDNKERTLRYLQANREVIDLMDKNIDRILHIAQYESGATAMKVESINLKSLLENIIQRFPVKDNVVIRLHYNLQQEEVTTDAHIIEAIVNNLVDNALKYTQANVEIDISLQQAGNQLLLVVKDNGIGIDKTHLPYIFDKFYRVPTGNVHDVKGYGIGLSYVKTLTEILKGVISVQSTPGKGTTFSIQFPEA